MMKPLIPTLALLILNLADGAPIKEKYVYSGNNAWATMNWAEEGCDYASYMDFDAGDSVSKILGNGKPELTKSQSVYAWYGRWFDCTDSSVKSIMVYFDYDDYVTPSTSVAIKTNLKSGSISSTYGAIMKTEVCDRQCTDYDWGTSCDFVCTGKELSVQKVEATFKATLVGTGIPYTSTSHYSSRYPDGFFQSKSSGRFTDAIVSVVSLTVNGDDMLIPSDANQYAYMYTTKSGSRTIYRDAK